MQLIVNAKTVECPQGASLLELLTQLGVNPKAVAVEHNGQLLSSDLFAQTGLAEGDVLELVRFVGGG